MVRTSRYTISQVDEAAGSTRAIVPRPSLLRWWSIQINSPAFVAFAASEPSRFMDAASHVTMTAGFLGNSFGWTNASLPGNPSAHRGRSNGSLPNEHTVSMPRDRR